MKKFLNNKGVTLVELVIAAVILGIIAAPLLSSILQVTKSTVSADIELKANAEAQKVIEQIKATGEYDKSVVYFDKLMTTQLPSASGAYYKMDISSALNNVNSKITDSSVSADISEYDRWDYLVEVSRNGNDATDSKVSIKKNPGTKENVASGRFGAEALALESGSSIDMIGSTLKLDIVGKTLDNRYRLLSEIIKNGVSSIRKENFKNFPANNGSILYNPSIVFKVVKILTPDEVAANKDIPEFDIEIVNSTFYSNAINNTVDEASDGSPKYSKHIIFNIFNDIDDADGSEIKVNSFSPYVDINRSGVTEISDQYRIKVTITRIEDNRVLKSISSTIGKPVLIP